MDGEIKIEFDNPLGGKVCRYFGKGYYFGDYYSLYEKPSEFNYISTTPLFIYTIPITKFQTLSAKYKNIYDRIVSNTAKNSRITNDTLKQSLSELITEKTGTKPDSNQLNLIYREATEEKAERIRSDRIRKKNAALLNFDLNLNTEKKNNSSEKNNENVNHLFKSQNATFPKDNENIKKEPKYKELNQKNLIIKTNLLTENNVLSGRPFENDKNFEDESNLESRNEERLEKKNSNQLQDDDDNNLYKRQGTASQTNRLEILNQNKT